MEIDIKIIETDDDYQSCLFIRKQVFIIGQNIPVEIELDDDKIDATYFLANVSGNPVGTARYRKTDFGIKLERFAVLENARNFGVGKALVLFIIYYLKNLYSIWYLILPYCIASVLLFFSLLFLFKEYNLPQFVLQYNLKFILK